MIIIIIIIQICTLIPNLDTAWKCIQMSKNKTQSSVSAVVFDMTLATLRKCLQFSTFNLNTELAASMYSVDKTIAKLGGRGDLKKQEPNIYWLVFIHSQENCTLKGSISKEPKKFPKHDAEPFLI